MKSGESEMEGARVSLLRSPNFGTIAWEHGDQSRCSQT